MPADTPDRPGVAALVAELDVRRRVRVALVAGAGVALAVFLLFAYLPGTDESLLYWASLAFVLASAVAGLVASVLVAAAAYRRTVAVAGLEPGRRSPTTLAVLVGLAGWVLVPVAAAIAVDRPSAGVRLGVALLTSGFVALVSGGLGVKLAGALSVTHRWRPPAAVAGAVAYTALVAGPAVGCPAGGPCLGTPDELVATAVGLDPGATAPAYALVALGGGLLVGVALALRDAAPPHGFFAGAVAAIATLPVVAAATGDPAAVRTTALYLPLVLGAAGACGSALVLAARSRS